MRGSFSITTSGGTTYDTYTQWGVILAENSVEQFIAPPPLKEYITNESALENGVQVLTTSAALPKVAARSITVEMNIIASSNSDLRTKLSSFVSTLKGGMLTIRITDHSADYFRVLYQSCTQFTDYDGRVAKFALRLIEPNPANRAQ